MAIASAHNIPRNKNALGFARRASHLLAREQSVSFDTQQTERTIKEALFACDPAMVYAYNQTGNFMHALQVQYKGDLPAKEELLKRYATLRGYAAQIQQEGLSTETKQRLAEEYVATKDPVTLHVLIKGYRPILRGIIGRAISGKSRHIQDCEDLEQILAEVLEKVAERYKPSRGVVFSTYVDQRLKGAIKDYFRDNDIFTRTERDHMKALEEARDEARENGETNITGEELARRASLSLLNSSE